jgi:NADH-quinone oxidoreductase subunit E
MLGADRVFDRIGRLFHLTLGATSPDGRFTLEATGCIGHCDKGPCISVDDAVYGHSQLSGIEAILKTCK